MNYLFDLITIRTPLHKKNKKGENDTLRHDYHKAKEFYQLQNTIKRILKDIFLIALGILSAGFGLKGFLLPNGFIDGGAVGISLLINNVSSINLSILLILVNIPFILLGLKTISKEFALKTTLAIIALALVVAYLPYPQITQDKLLVAVFGGFFLGAGIGLAVRGGSVIDGTEVLAIAIYRRIGISVGDIILIINILIFIVAAYLLSIETALYSVLIYLSASKTVDFIIEGIEELTGVSVISVKSEEIRDMIITDMGKGVTIYNGERGYGRTGSNQNKEIKIIFTVITRLEVNKLNASIKKIDPNAFIFMNSIKDSKGGMIKKRPLK
jgi:uncharacterized membrane-anchored protein YitT (DUF2179 family)